MLQTLVVWLQGIPLAALYGLIGLVAFVEGIVPPVPGDIAAAFLAILAARAGGDWLPTAIVVAAGSVAGNMLVWWLGRYYGADWMTARIARFGFAKSGEKAEAAEFRIMAAYERYGWVALLVSRFIPGIRAMVPVAAGALRVPLVTMLGVFSVASFFWYGLVVWLAFKLGTDWDEVRSALARASRDVGIGAFLVAVVLILIFWLIRKRRRKE